LEEISHLSSIHLITLPVLLANCADVSRISSKLVSDSKQFKWGAKRLNVMDRWRKLLPYAIILLLVVFLLWWRFGW
jgi:hypothetical protein